MYLVLFSDVFRDNIVFLMQVSYADRWHLIMVT